MKEKDNSPTPHPDSNYPHLDDRPAPGCVISTLGRNLVMYRYWRFPMTAGIETTQ